MFFEVYEVAPVCHPLIEQSAVMGFHQLIAPLKFVIDPTRYVQQALRCQTPMIAKPPIDGDSIFILEVLHDHVHRFCHRRTFPIRVTAMLRQQSVLHEMLLGALSARTSRDSQVKGKKAEYNNRSTGLIGSETFMEWDRGLYIVLSGALVAG